MRKRFFLLPVLLLFVCSSLAFGDYVPGQIIVKFKPGVVKLPKGLAVASVKAAAISAASVRALYATHGVVQIRQLYKDALAVRPDWKHLENDYVLVFPKEKDVERVVKDFKHDPNVEMAEPDLTVRAFDTTPNDTHFNLQWGPVSIEATKAWDITTGDASAIIAVIDTGLNYNHEDFSGKVDLTHAKNYISGGTDPLDDFGHGTAVSGVIGAVANNGKGVAGMDWSAKILPIKVLNSSGGGSMANVSAALAYLAALKSTGVNIVAINMSLGQYNGKWNDSTNKYIDMDPDSLKERCQDAYDQGIVLVAAAGNGNVDWTTYPAYYPTVLAVAATDVDKKRSVWWSTDSDTNQTQASNYASWVDISAPGTYIYSSGHPDSTVQENTYYANWSGTSLAAPYIAGLAALVKAANPAMTNAQIMERIQATADNIDSLNPGYAGKLGSGEVNAYKAVGGITARITSPANNAYVRGTVSVVGTAMGNGFTNYLLEALKNSNIAATIESKTTTVESGALGSWDTTGLNDTYTLRLRAFSSGGASAEASVTTIVDNTSPEAVITSPTENATVDGSVTIVGTAADLYFDRYVLEYGAGSSPSVYQNIGTYYTAVNGGALGTWETAGLSGDHTLRLSAYDRVGNLSQASRLLHLSGSQSPTKEVEPQESLPLTYVLPNPFNRSSTAEVSFNYTLAGNFATRLYLFDVGGRLIWQKTYSAGENGGKSGQNNPSWNGQELFGGSVLPGVYVYQIVADGRVMARGKIAVF